MDIPGLSVERGEKRADDRISGATCEGSRKTNRNKAEEQPEKRMERVEGKWTGGF